MTRRAGASGPGVWLLGLALGAAAVAGCAREGEELVIVSPRPDGERAALATEFRDWAEATPGTASGPIRIRWIPLAPGDDATRVVRRRVPPDLVLDVGVADLRRLAREGRLVAIERTTHPAWCVTWRGPLVLALNPAREDGRARTVAFDDFRHDPVALAWARGELADGSWAAGYARLVREAGDPRRIGRQPGAALAAFERGEVARVLCVQGRMPGPRRGIRLFEAPRTPIEWVEGVAVIRGGGNPSLAQEFVRFLADRGRAETPPSGAGGPAPEDDPDASALLADLLGATLVDAQDELWAAWARLEAAGHPERAERWMAEPPPWPPASIDKLLKRGDEAAALLETLTAEIAPEADVRAWLLRSWLAPPRRLEGPLLAELAAAADGRLVREPRFRAWLRGEWTAWARQRYRRVARLAGAAVP